MAFTRLPRKRGRAFRCNLLFYGLLVKTAIHKNQAAFKPSILKAKKQKDFHYNPLRKPVSLINIKLLPKIYCYFCSTKN
jgi:hypothetical protein